MVESTTPPSDTTRSMEMGVLGYLIAAVLALLLLPLLPFLVLAWLWSKFTGERAAPAYQGPQSML